ncbi:MAG: BrnT family toxin [Sulfurovum sp.]|nr:BrnT family toxin [Sulfurovum sp.]
MNYNFEWDMTKAKLNLQKHKISFETASSIFRDEKAISLSDEEHSEDEERWLTIGLDEVTRTLVVIHTFVTIDRDNCTIRIMSARKATKNEVKIYEKG